MEEVIIAQEDTEFVTGHYPVAQKLLYDIQQYNMVFLCISLGVCKFLEGVNPDEFQRGNLIAAAKKLARESQKVTGLVLSISEERMKPLNEMTCKGVARFAKGQELLEELQRDAQLAATWTSDWIAQRDSDAERSVWSHVVKIIIEDEAKRLRKMITKFVAKRVGEFPGGEYVRKET